MKYRPGVLVLRLPKSSTHTIVWDFYIKEKDESSDSSKLTSQRLYSSDDSETPRHRNQNPWALALGPTCPTH